MTRLVISRLVQLPLIMAVVFLVTFALVWVAPGDPLSREDRNVPEAVQRALRARYHLESPGVFLKEYTLGLVTRGDLGPSLHHQGQSVNDIIAGALPVSLAVGALAIVFGLVVGLGAGVIGAARPGSLLDSAGLGLALVGVSLPTFVTGSVLLVVFVGLLGWFPIGAAGLDPMSLVLPAVTLGIVPAAYIARLVRLGLADVMSSDYVRTARAKGLPERRVLGGHALKVAFLPVLSFLGPAGAAALTGSFVVEQVFALPGLGKHFVEAVQGKDQFLIQGLVLVYSGILVLFNLAVDVAYAWVDPRIELGA